MVAPFPGEEQISSLKCHHFVDKEVIYSEAETTNTDRNTPGEYFNSEKRWLPNSLKNYSIWDICSKISSETTWQSQDMNYFKVSLRSPYCSIWKKLRFDSENNIKV